jgi:hypothetical protein
MKLPEYRKDEPGKPLIHYRSATAKRKRRSITVNEEDKMQELAIVGNKDE